MLFSNAYQVTGNSEKALRIWAAAYTPRFKMKYGDWENGETFLTLDMNGEPTVDTVMYTNRQINDILKTYFANWTNFQPGNRGFVKESEARRFLAALKKKFPDIKAELQYSSGEPGYAKVVFIPDEKQIPFTTNRKEIRQQKEVVNPLMDKLMSKFPGLTYEWIKPGELNQSDHYEKVDGIRAFVRNNKIYLVEGRVLPEDGIEEVMHVFVEMLRQSRPTLFKGLLDAASKDPKYQATFIAIYNHYSDKIRNKERAEIIIQSEFLGKSLAAAMRNELETNPDGRPATTFGKLIQRFLDWLANLLDIGAMSGRETLNEIVAYINTEDVAIPLPEDNYTYYSAAPTSDPDNLYDPDDRDDAEEYNKKKKRPTQREKLIERGKLELEKLRLVREFVTRNALSTAGAEAEEAKRLSIVDLLIANVQQKIQDLEDGAETISVSKYGGSEKTEIARTKTADIGASFGEFYHMFLEELQFEYMKSNRSPSTVFSDPSWFDEFYEKHKDLIKFDKFDKQVVRQIAGQLAAKLDALTSEGKIILPEIEIAVKDQSGKIVIGRLDILTVDKRGKTSVIDLKTKKVNYIPGKPNYYNERVFTMEPSSRQDTLFKDGVDPVFAQFRLRNPLKKYHIQLAIYGEMISALGINPNDIQDRKIWAVAYNVQQIPNTEIYNLEGYGIGEFNNADWKSIDPNGVIDAAAQSRFRPAEERQDTDTTAEEIKKNPFAQVDKDSLTQMVERILKLAQNTLSALEKEKNAIKNNENISVEDANKLVGEINKRVASILSIKEKIEQEGLDNPTDESIRLSKAAIIKMAIDVFSYEIENISNKVDEVDIPSTYSLNNVQNQNMLKTLQEYNSTLENIASYIRDFKNTITSMENLPKDTKEAIQEYFDEMLRKSSNASAVYVNVGKKIVKTVILNTIGPANLNTTGPAKFEKVFGEMRAMLGPKLAAIEKTIADIESNRATASSVTSNFSNVIKNIFRQSKKTNLEALKEEAAKIRKIMQINKLDENTLDDYLEGIFGNQDSVWYMGSTISGSNSMIVNMDQLIGQNANSEAVISAVWQYLRNVTESARIEAVNWMQETDVNKATDEIIKAHGGDLYKANESFTEVVDVNTQYDKDGNVTETKQFLQALDPANIEFYNTYNRYKAQLKLLKNLIITTSQAKKTAPESEQDTIQAEIDRLRDLENALGLEFIEWQIEETNTEFKPEVLRLFRASGTANTEISDLYRQIQAIENSAHGVQNLTEEQQEAIDSLEAQISKIRERLKQEDPALQEKLDKMLEYFEYDLNYSLWVKKKAEIEARGNPLELERWHRNNSVMAPTQEWQEQIERIYEQIAAVREEDPVMQDLIKKRNSIKNRNKVRGKFNLLYMSEQDVEEFVKLDEQIRERGMMAAETTDMITKQYLAERFNLLASMRKEVLSDSYTKKRDALKSAVELSYKTYKQLSEQHDKEASPSLALRQRMVEAYNQYQRDENIFAEFFNKYNYTKYEVGNDVIALRKDINEQPKRFVYVSMPADPNDIEQIPNNKYKIKRLKQEAYNPDYQQSFVPQREGAGFYPYPKAIRFNKDTSEFEINPRASQRYVSSKFKQMQADPVKHKFYTEWFIKNFVLKQKSASGRPLGFFAPYVQQRGLENIISKGVEGVGREIKEKMQELQYANSKMEEATNQSGVTGKQKIYFPENQRVTADLTSTDMIGSIVNWNTGYYLNKNLAVSALEVEGILAYLNDIRARLSADSRDLTGTRDADRVAAARKIDVIIKEIEYSHMKFNYGQMYEKGASQHPLLNRKTLRVIMQLAAFGRMAFDIPMQFGNLLSGNVQAFLSTQEARFATPQDYIEAKKVLYSKFFPKLLADYGKQSGLSLETLIYYYMNPSLKDLSNFADMNTVKKMRRLANKVWAFQDISMALQDKGEVEIGMTTMLMIMINRKFEQFEINPDGSVVIENGVKKVKRDSEGNVVYVNATEVFKQVNGAIQLRNDVNVTEQEMQHLKGTIMTEIYRFQGNYAKATKSSFSGTMIGTLYNFYRNYLIPAVSNRFSMGGYEGVGSAYSWDAPEAYTGYYVALMKMFKYYGLGKAGKALLYDTFLPGFAKKQIKFDSDEGMDYYRYRAVMASREVLVGLLFYMLYQALRNMIMDDDSEELTFVELSLARSLVKVSNESRSMIPLPIIGKPGDYIDNFAQLTSALKEGKTLWNLSEDAFWSIMYTTTGSEHAYERAFYQRDTDRWQEGDPRLYKSVADLLAWSNIVDAVQPREAAERAVKMK
jgi:hypothetical protein